MVEREEMEGMLIEGHLELLPVSIQKVAIMERIPLIILIYLMMVILHLAV